ncbi:hypothetical protein MYAM1_000463 [Malassezia yamatoensis]|uniref:Uncharacterized protein n=1 Tax=Malassezia yamatoensis TaxID=253288 RepID=A0AAJ5YNU1_9BASI|nr:hypothetical protein MYAM1_000463 [Malassezia yamatoensis]
MAAWLSENQCTAPEGFSIQLNAVLADKNKWNDCWLWATNVYTRRSRQESASQVFNNYGAKSNEELLLLYGFVEPEGPDDMLTITLRDAHTDSTRQFHWHKSSAAPPTEMMVFLESQVTEPKVDRADIASLLRQAEACEALEEFFDTSITIFNRVQYEVDDALPWISDDGSDGVRDYVLESIRVYREGMDSY